MKKKVIASVVAGLVLAAGLPLSASAAPSKAMVRVAHLSPDAPAVDVWVNHTRVLQNVEYSDVSDYLEVKPGMQRIRVVAAGTTSPAVIDAHVPFAGGKYFTVAAVGKLADIAPRVYWDNSSKVLDGKARIRFVHTSPDAPAVDVAVTGGPVLFSNVKFKQATAYASVAAGTYNLEVRLAGTNTVVKTLPNTSLDSKRVYSAFAIGLAGGTPALNALLLNDGQSSMLAKVRVAHLSPDAPAVDVWLNATRVLQNVEYQDVSAYLDVPAGNHRVQVVATGTTSPAVIDARISVSKSKYYTVAAVGKLANISPRVLWDNSSRVLDGKARIRFVHTSPDAPAVDVAVTGGPVLFSNVKFKQATAYASVAAGTYNLEVRLAGTTTVVKAIPGVVLANQSVSSAYAVGLASGTPALDAQLLKDGVYATL